MTDLFAYKLLTQDQWLAWKESGTSAGAPIDMADGCHIHPFHAGARPGRSPRNTLPDIDPRFW